MSTRWTPSSWQNNVAAQQPKWPDQNDLEQALKQISSYPPLVFAGEARSLLASLGQVASGNAFLLQAGDCAESFEEFTAVNIREKLRVILQMALVLTYSMGVPVVKVGRIAGQFAKPRSSDTEKIGGVELPSFRGHMVNDPAPHDEARIPDPQRLVQAYHQSASTLNLLRAFTKGGFADLNRVHAWNQEFVSSSAAGQRYEQVAGEVERALAFMRACGIDTESHSPLHEVDFYTSHEALILEYEKALTRIDSRTNNPYDVSAHFVWIGERTRQLDGAHMDFAEKIHNPIGVKLGPKSTPDELLAIIKKLNPSNEPGRLTFITRMGAGVIREKLPSLIEAVSKSGAVVLWVCDPMHGNTFESPSGYKTRKFDDVIDEVKGFFEVHKKMGTHPGGIHIELTGDDVTECIGGGEAISHEDLSSRYETACDPRLNHTQSLELAFLVAEMLRDRKK